MTTEQYWQSLDALAATKGTDRLLEAAELLRANPALPLLIPLYIIHCLSRYECEGDPSKISAQLTDEQAITRLINLYKMTFTGYFNVWSAKYSGLGYNEMIKNPIDYSMMDQSRQMALAMFPKA